MVETTANVLRAFCPSRRPGHVCQCFKGFLSFTTSRTCLRAVPTFLRTYLLTSLPTCLPAQLPNYLPSFLPYNDLPTYPPTDLPTYPPTDLPASLYVAVHLQFLRHATDKPDTCRNVCRRHDVLLKPRQNSSVRRRRLVRHQAKLSRELMINV